jgi:UDP-N-acetylmuramyl pentapeptide phosphotransferase/UDP-N-acetylglucosamine-1-phosphate transferase
MVLTGLVLFLGIVLVSWTCAGLVRFLPIVAHPEEGRSSHTAPTPTLGGLALSLSYACGLCCQHLFFQPFFFPPSSLMFLGLGALTLLGMGIIDDIKGLSFLFRLVIQLCVAGALISHFFGHTSFWIQGSLILLMGGFLNAFNFIDGLNGMAAGAAFSVACFAIISLPHVSPLYFSLIPALVGFLIWNCRGLLFMGDTGSLFLGYAIIAPLFLDSPSLLENILKMGHVLMPYLLDVSTTVALRLLRGQTVVMPHKDFLFHHLSRGGKYHLPVSFGYAAASLIQGGILWMMPPLSTSLLLSGVTLETLLYGALIIGYRRRFHA